MKKAISYIISFVMVLAFVFVPDFEAHAANVSLGVSASTINIGDSVTVTVSAPDGFTATVDLTFSSDIVSYTSASSEVGVNGSNVRVNVGKLSMSGSNSVSVTFKANTSGTASFSAGVASAVDDNTVEDVALGGASTSITVANQVQEPPVEQPTTPPVEQPTTPPVEQPTTPDQPVTPPAGGQDTPSEAPKSGDNSLSSLKISSGTLSPAFKYNVTKYTAKVGYDVSNLVVSATPSHAGAKIESVTGNGNVNLEVGDNTIQIVVQAENGLKATYTVVVTRSAEGEEVPPPSESESESETESETQETPEAEEVLQWNGQTLLPVDDIPNDVVPSDFTKETITLNDAEIPCFTFANGSLKVLYLQNAEGISGLYVYNEAQKTVYPFVKLGTETNYIFVLIPDETNSPNSGQYTPCTLTIEGKGDIQAYQFIEPAAETPEETTGWFGAETFYAAEPVITEFYLVYGMNASGETGWYVYDSVEETVQRYLLSVHNTGAQTDNVVENVPEHTEDYDKLAAELEAAKNMQLIIICVAVFVVVVLVIIIVNLILRRHTDELSEDEGFDDEEDEDEFLDNDEDEYYDEYDSDEDEDTTEESASESLITEDADLEDEEEMEIEFYEMPQADITEELQMLSEQEMNTDEEVEITSCEITKEPVGDKAADESIEDEVEIEFYEITEKPIDENEVESYETEETMEDEVEIEFYEITENFMDENKMESYEAKETMEDKAEVKSYEMTEKSTDEVEVEFYEMKEEITKDDEVEFYNMEELLMKEAVALEETSKKEKEIPEKNIQAKIPASVGNINMDDEDDDDLEFIDLD